MAGRYGTSDTAQLPVGLNGHALARRARVQPWKDQANCRGLDPDLFHPPSVGGAPIARAAKEVCDSCNVRLECLAYAIAHGEELGIWGGTTERERRTVRRALLAVRSSTLRSTA